MNRSGGRGCRRAGAPMQAKACRYARPLGIRQQEHLRALAFAAPIHAFVHSTDHSGAMPTRLAPTSTTAHLPPSCWSALSLPRSARPATHCSSPAGSRRPWGLRVTFLAWCVWTKHPPADQGPPARLSGAPHSLSAAGKHRISAPRHQALQLRALHCPLGGHGALSARQQRPAGWAAS